MKARNFLNQMQSCFLNFDFHTKELQNNNPSCLTLSPHLDFHILLLLCFNPLFSLSFIFEPVHSFCLYKVWAFLIPFLLFPQLINTVDFTPQPCQQPLPCCYKLYIFEPPLFEIELVIFDTDLTKSFSSMLGWLHDTLTLMINTEKIIKPVSSIEAHTIYNLRRQSADIKGGQRVVKGDVYYQSKGSTQYKQRENSQFIRCMVSLSTFACQFWKSFFLAKKKNPVLFSFFFRETVLCFLSFHMFYLVLVSFVLFCTSCSHSTLDSISINPLLHNHHSSLKSNQHTHNPSINPLSNSQSSLLVWRDLNIYSSLFFLMSLTFSLYHLLCSLSFPSSSSASLFGHSCPQQLLRNKTLNFTDSSIYFTKMNKKVYLYFGISFYFALCQLLHSMTDYLHATRLVDL
ncbi:hypothetical protein VP01_749g1 [Puccinia sorghi]|uniref:Uncharacterized protein n=1 Tax=Puccinia sorghi TaxID=27349 RepID=A0A0L6UD50_9BASI|nr:hypothetical protein VP01_749g1 [Puccinia sorghi]